MPAMQVPVLIITYYWPPSGGAGVQRWLRLSKYLLQLGWEPFILTIKPEYATYPALDTSLEKDVSPEIKVFRTKATDWFTIYSHDKSKVPSSGFANSSDTSLKEKFIRFIRGNFFIPDPRRGWNKYAFKKACELIEKEGIRHVITTSPPHSTQLIGLKIKKRYPALMWIADLRDPWTDIYYYDQFYPTFLARQIDSWYEKRVLRNADKITTVGPSLKNTFSLKVSEVADKTEVITNGFDDADFKTLTADKPPIFTITYAGTISNKYPIDGFLKALNKIRKNNIDFLLRFVGTVPGNIQEQIMTDVLKDSTKFIPYAHHDEAIKYMINSSMLLLVIPEHNNNKNVITGKIFEYIASGKPILCLGPEDGDAAVILAQSGSGICCAYGDIIKIENFILSVISNTHDQETKTDEFMYKNIAKKLVSFIG